MQPICRAEVPLFFSAYRGNTDTPVPVSHEFTNSVAVASGLLHSQPLTNTHFHFLFVVELATSQMALQTNRVLRVTHVTTPYRKIKCSINITGQETLNIISLARLLVRIIDSSYTVAIKISPTVAILNVTHF